MLLPSQSEQAVCLFTTPEVSNETVQSMSCADTA